MKHALAEQETTVASFCKACHRQFRAQLPSPLHQPAPSPLVLPWLLSSDPSLATSLGTLLEWMAIPEGCKALTNLHLSKMRAQIAGSSATSTALATATSTSSYASAQASVRHSPSYNHIPSPAQPASTKSSAALRPDRICSPRFVHAERELQHRQSSYHCIRQRHCHSSSGAEWDDRERNCNSLCIHHVYSCGPSFIKSAWKESF